MYVSTSSASDSAEKSVAASKNGGGRVAHSQLAGRKLKPNVKSIELYSLHFEKVAIQMVFTADTRV